MGAISESGHTPDEWKKILEVPDSSKQETGTQLTLSIEPSLYYQKVGSEITLSGVLTSIFGPVSDSCIIILKGTGSSLKPYLNTTTDTNGSFNLSDLVDRTGQVRYQAVYELKSPGYQEPGNITSKILELSGVPDTAVHPSVMPGITIRSDTNQSVSGSPLSLSGTVQGISGPVKNSKISVFRRLSSGSVWEEIGYRYTDDNGEWSFIDTPEIASGDADYRIRSDMGIPGSSYQESDLVRITIIGSLGVPVNTSPDLRNNTTPADNQALSLLLNESEFISGQKINFTGKLANNQTPLAHREVALEIIDPINRTEQKIGDTLVTGNDGSYTTSFQLTGPDPFTLQARSESLKTNETPVSLNRTLQFIDENFTPGIRQIPDKREITAVMEKKTVNATENISVNGWYSDGDGNGLKYTPVRLFRFNPNFWKWEPYPDSSPALTNKDGYYSFSVPAENKTGSFYISVIDKRSYGLEPVISNILGLRVVSGSGNQTGKNQVRIQVSARPPVVQVNETAQILISLQDQTGTAIAGEPVLIYFSQDGFTWFMNGKGSVPTGPDGNITLTDTPKKAGVHYYRALYNGSSSYTPVESELLVLPVLNTTFSG